MVFVGACEEFFNCGHEFGRLLGTSAGAITATLLRGRLQAQGNANVLTETKNGVSVFSTFMGPPKEFSDEELRAGALRRLLEGINFTSIWDSVESIIDFQIVKALATNETARHAVALIERGGWYGADAFVTWLGEKLDCGSIMHTPRQFSGLTMSEFFDATKVELSLVASDTTDGRLLVINHHTAPDCPVIYAVRMSMSIPMVWDEIIWNESWGKYRKTDISGHVVVDGGILSNFPIELFVSDQPPITNVMGPKQDIPTIGMLIQIRKPPALLVSTH